MLISLLIINNQENCRGKCLANVCILYYEPEFGSICAYNPLLPNGNYSYRIIKILFSKKEGIKKRISYERRVYESVDDENLS